MNASGNVVFAPLTEKLLSFCPSIENENNKAEESRAEEEAQ